MPDYSEWWSEATKAAEAISPDTTDTQIDFLWHAHALAGAVKAGYEIETSDPLLRRTLEVLK
jgi:hypothetical protein